jgi:hypothetical protein
MNRNNGFHSETLAALRLCVRLLQYKAEKSFSRQGAKAQRRYFSPKVQVHLWTFAALRLCVSLLQYKAQKSFSR